MGSGHDAPERPSVLLVEDDRLTRTVLRHDLKLCGFDVDVAENGDVALKKLQKGGKQRKNGYDLVLTDVFMPKVDGESLVRTVCSDFRDVPIAVMSANCEDEDKKRLLGMGASQYLVKPLGAESLAKLRRLVPEKVARDTREPNSTREPTPRTALGTTSKQSVLCSSLLQAASLMSAELASNTNAAANDGSAPPADHSTGSELTGMEGPDAQGQIRTMAAAENNVSKAPHNSANQATSGTNPAAPASSLLSPMQMQSSGFAGSSSGQVMNVAVMMPVDFCSMMQEQQGNSGAAQGSIPTSQANGGSTAQPPAQGPATQVTFISSSASMAPVDVRKAALVRFREKKARSHFAPKVRYFERKKLAEARPRYKGQFVKLEQLPKEQQEEIAQRKLAAAAAAAEARRSKVSRQGGAGQQGSTGQPDAPKGSGSAGSAKA